MCSKYLRMNLVYSVNALKRVDIILHFVCVIATIFRSLFTFWTTSNLFTLLLSWRYDRHACITNETNKMRGNIGNAIKFTCMFWHLSECTKILSITLVRINWAIPPNKIFESVCEFSPSTTIAYFASHRTMRARKTIRSTKKECGQTNSTSEHNYMIHWHVSFSLSLSWLLLSYPYINTKFFFVATSNMCTSAIIFLMMLFFVAAVARWSLRKIQ